MFLSLLLGALAIMASCSPSQQVDTAYRPPIPNPTHELGRGPVIWIDQAHNNIVTAEPSRSVHSFRCRAPRRWVRSSQTQELVHTPDAELGSRARHR